MVPELEGPVLGSSLNVVAEAGYEYLTSSLVFKWSRFRTPFVITGQISPVFGLFVFVKHIGI